MITPDLFNGLFELFGGFLYILNIRILLREKVVHGISLVPTAFFTSWGFWNLFYYSNLDQWFSFAGGILLVLTNGFWLYLALKYRHNTKPDTIIPNTEVKEVLSDRFKMTLTIDGALRIKVPSSTDTNIERLWINRCKTIAEQLRKNPYHCTLRGKVRASGETIALRTKTKTICKVTGTTITWSDNI